MTTDMEVVKTLQDPQPIQGLVKEKSARMSYFLEASHLDSATAELLTKYDRDGNGSFSKDEVVGIILDLREAMQSNEILDASNKMFKRILMIAIIFSILLLTSMFGLCYAVAVVTAKINVNSDGVMTNVDGSSIVKTDSTAFTYKTTKADTGVDCLSASERETILRQVLSGSTIRLEHEHGVNDDDNDGTQQGKQIRQLTSSVIQQKEDGSVCFTTFGNGIQTCLVPTNKCESAMARRRGRGRLLVDYGQGYSVKYERIWHHALF